MKRLPWLVFSAAFVVAGQLIAQDAPKPQLIEPPDVVKGITARELGGHMKFLASDLMRGRDTASHEIRIAAEYLATRLSAAGAEPVGDVEQGKTTYFQRFPLEVTTPLQEGTSLAIEVDRDGSKRVIPLQLGADVTFQPAGLAPGEVEAPVVFAGYGRSNPAEKVDDYDGLDVKHQFVLVLAGQPPAQPKEGEKAEEKAAEPAKTKGRPGGRFGGANLVKLEPALKHGALGVIVARPSSDPGARPGAAPAVGRPLQGFGRPAMTLGSPSPSIPLFTLTDPARDLLLPAIGLELDKPGSRPLPGVRARFTFAAKKELKDDRNVVGFFPGSDPEKKKEVVIYSAHYDHVGVDAQGVIFNGSDDNASGTSALLEIAEAFGDGPRPARSVAFLWVSGEEKGLFGSNWFSNHISLPPDYKIVADINIDMVSRNDGKSIGVTPSSGHASYTNLAALAEEAAKAEGMEVKYNADSFFNRTDSANFARKGIPVVFFFSGVHEDYHKSTDDVEKADFDKAARVARAAYRLGWTVAQTPEAPKKPKAD
jgi:hypothetical protein